MEIAKGEYILFPDADDALRPDALEVVAAGIAGTHADIVAYSFSYDPGFSRADEDQGLETGVYEGERYRKVLEFTCVSSFNSMSMKAFRRDLVDMDVSYEGFRGLKYGEDCFQILPMPDRARKLLRVRDILYYYRRHVGSTMTTYDPSQIPDPLSVADRALAAPAG